MGKYCRLSKVTRPLLLLLGTFLQHARQPIFKNPSEGRTGNWTRQFTEIWVLPDWRTRGCFENNSGVIHIGYWTWIRVPKVLELSSMKYSFPILRMREWVRETDMSSPILTSQEVFLPIWSVDLLSVLRMKKTFDLVNSSLWLFELRVSRMMKLSWGFSTSMISTILLLMFTEKGNFYLHNSQLIFLYFRTTWPFTALRDLLRSSHSRRHFKWMPPIVPEQLQGDIIGLKSSA